MLSDVILYIIVRSDLKSLGPGKACAQVSHAANQCVFDIRNSNKDPLRDQLLIWEGNHGFGTCVVLSATTGEHLILLVNELKAAGHFAAVVHDETYPLSDGRFTHHIPVDTCAYVFGSKSLLEPLLNPLPLME